jgi:hypothetical protein
MEPSFRSFPLTLARKTRRPAPPEEGVGRVLDFVKCPTGHERGHDAVDRLAPKNLRMRSEAMSYKHTAEKLADYRRQIRDLRQKMRDVQAEVEPEPVKDYTFRRAGGGSVPLSGLFATTPICSSSTTWARAVLIARCGRTGSTAPVHT